MNRVLFVHQNFPGQYRHLAAHYAADAGTRVVAVLPRKVLMHEEKPFHTGSRIARLR